MNKTTTEAQQLLGKAREAQAKIAEVNGKWRAAEEGVAALRDEKLELVEQVEILTEERDVARVNEEALFLELDDKEEDLFRAREGYTWATARRRFLRNTLFFQIDTRCVAAQLTAIDAHA